MNYRSHLKEIRKEIIRCVSEDKKELTHGIAAVMKRTAGLLKTNSYDFWVNQLEEISWEEIPTTKHAVDAEKNRWENLYLTQGKTSLPLLSTLENLLTYWEEDDLCEMQGQFYYYKDGTTNQLFCESDFGTIRDFGNQIEIEICKIATIEDLKNNGIVNEINLNKFF